MQNRSAHLLKELAGKFLAQFRSANRKGYDDVVFAAFGFDATAQDAIEGGSHPKLRLHMALIRPDDAPKRRKKA